MTHKVLGGSYSDGEELESEFEWDGTAESLQNLAIKMGGSLSIAQ